MNLNIQITGKDPLFTDAARTVVKKQNCSLAFLALELELPAERTAIILADLEVAGIISPFDPGKGRKVMFADEASLDEHLKTLVP